MTTAHPFFVACGTLGDVAPTPAGSAAQDVLAANGLPTTSTGGVQAISAATGLPTNLTQAQSAAFSALPPSVQATIKSAQTDAATAAPAITLASTIASGGVPSTAEIIGGLAAVATLATGNPLVGATIGAIASIGAVAVGLLKDLFDALGLYSHVASYNYTGFIRTGGGAVDQVPWGPGDPFWIDVSTFDKLETFYSHGDANHPPLSGNFDSSMYSLLYYAFVQGMTPAAAAAATGQNPYRGYLDANAWDAYIATLMIQNLQYWANAKAYVPPQDLLTGALQAWNAIHAPTSTKVYSPPPPGTPACSGLEPLTSLVLGPCGNSVAAAASGGVSVDVPPVTVNLGAILPNVVAAAQQAAAAELQAAGGGAPATSSSSSSAGTAVAVVAIGGFAAGAIWAGMTGRLAGLARWLHL